MFPIGQGVVYSATYKTQPVHQAHNWLYNALSPSVGDVTKGYPSHILNWVMIQMCTD